MQQVHANIVYYAILICVHASLVYYAILICVHCVDESSTDASTTPCASCSPEWTFIVYVDLYMFFSMSPVGAPVVYTQHDRKHATFMCLQLISTIADRVPTLHDLDNLGSSFQLLPDAGYPASTT